MGLFRDGEGAKKIGNKSGFLAGIMRRYGKEVVTAEASGMAGTGDAPAAVTAAAVTADDDDDDDDDDGCDTGVKDVRRIAAARGSA